jgi:hypothetical protein
LIDVKVARSSDGQVEPAMACYEIQHVIEKPDAGAIVVTALAIDRQRDLDLGLGSPPIDHGAPPSSCR